MIDDLDTLRPEVREAIKEIEFACTVRSSNEDEYGTIRSELLRLAHDCAEHAAWRDINERARFDQQQRSEKAEAELAALKARIEGSRHAFLGPNMDRITFLAEDIGPIGRYALVKVEE